MEFKKLRIAKGFDNQQALASLLKISRTTISMWESGISYPTVPTIHKLAKIFNEPAEVVFKSFSVKSEVSYGRKRTTKI